MTTGSTAIDAAQDAVGPFYCKWALLMLSSLSTSTPKSFSAKLLYNFSVMRLFLCICRALPFAFLNFMRLFSLSRSLCVVTQPFSTSHSSHVCIIHGILAGILYPIIQIINEDIKQNLPQYGSLSTTLVSCLKLVFVTPIPTWA